MSVVNGAQHDALNKAAWRGHTEALDWLLYDEGGPKLERPAGLAYMSKANGNTGTGTTRAGS